MPRTDSVCALQELTQALETLEPSDVSRRLERDPSKAKLNMA